VWGFFGGVVDRKVYIVCSTIFLMGVESPKRKRKGVIDMKKAKKVIERWFGKLEEHETEELERALERIEWGGIDFSEYDEDELVELICRLNEDFPGADDDLSEDERRELLEDVLYHEVRARDYEDLATGFKDLKEAFGSETLAEIHRDGKYDIFDWKTLRIECINAVSRCFVTLETARRYEAIYEF